MAEHKDMFYFFYEADSVKINIALKYKEIMPIF